MVTSAVAVTSDGSLIALLALAALSGILACRWLMGNDLVFFTFLTIFVCVLVDAGDPLSVSVPNASRRPSSGRSSDWSAHCYGHRGGGRPTLADGHREPSFPAGHYDH